MTDSGDDDTSETDDASNDGTSETDNAGDGDSSTDYTQMTDSGSGDTGDTSTDGDTDESGGDGSDTGTDDQSGDDSTTDDNADSGDGNGTDLKSLEKTLFADLTPEQMSIKNSELLQNYMDLYETLNHIFDNINKIPKNYNNTRVLSFITDKILDLKDMVHSIITVSYATKTYVENLTVYKQCLLILQQIDGMLQGLVGSKTNENA